jgi:RNase P protein component
MLKNPVHHFRRDGKRLITDLFILNFLPRSPFIDRQINEAVAYRHLLKNKLIKFIPEEKKHANLFYSSFFNDIYLDMRPEDPSDSGRISVSVKSSNLPAYIIHSIERKVRYLIRSRLSSTPLYHDLLILPKPSVYFSEEKKILQDLQNIHSIPKSSWVYRESEFILVEEENLYKMLKISYSSQPTEFFSNFKKIAKELKNENSCILVRKIQKIIKKKPKLDIQPLRIQLKKWCKNEGISGNFYKFISDL